MCLHGAPGRSNPFHTNAPLGTGATGWRRRGSGRERGCHSGSRSPTTHGHVSSLNTRLVRTSRDEPGSRREAALPPTEAPRQPGPCTRGGFVQGPADKARLVRPEFTADTFPKVNSVRLSLQGRRQHLLPRMAFKQWELDEARRFSVSGVWEAAGWHSPGTSAMAHDGSWTNTRHPLRGRRQGLSSHGIESVYTRLEILHCH